MKTFKALTVAAVVLGSTGIAYAQLAQIVSPPLPTHAGTDGACYVRNTSNNPIPVEVTIHSNNSIVVQFDTCNAGPLPGGHTCVVLAALPDESYAACYAKAERTGKLRGTFELRETQSLINPHLRVNVASDLK